MKRAWLPLAVPLALAVLVFARTVGFPFVNWDDPSHFLDSPLAEHPLARGWRGLFLTREIGYPAPVLLLSFALDRVLWGLHAGPYHVEDLLLHLANVAMLFRLGTRTRLSTSEASAVATLFAVHPLVVEPVCWITGRKDLLSTALVFGAALIAAGREGSSRSAPRWLAANALLVVAVLVLPRAVVGPILVAVLVHTIRPEWSIRAVALRVVPALLLALGVVAIGARQIAELGAVPPQRAPGAVVADVAGAWALQLGHVLFPVDLLAYYFRVPGDPPLAWMVVAGTVTVIALAAVALRAPPGSPTRAGTILALVAYAPVSCVFVIRRWTADSYMYVPLAMLALAAVPLVARAWPTRLAPFGRLAAIALAVVLSFLSLTGATRWSSSTNVWAGSIERYPGEPLAYEHEGLGLVADGRLAESHPIFVRMAELFPDWQDTLVDEVRAYDALGDEARATQVLAHGVRLGEPDCVRTYWLRLLEAPTPPDPSQRDLVAAAFRAGFPAMKEGLRDRARFRKVVQILDALGLEELAGEARSHLAAMKDKP